MTVLCVVPASTNSILLFNNQALWPIHRAARAMILPVTNRFWEANRNLTTFYGGAPERMLAHSNHTPRNIPNTTPSAEFCSPPFRWRPCPRGMRSTRFSAAPIGQLHLPYYGD